MADKSFMSPRTDVHAINQSGIPTQGNPGVSAISRKPQLEDVAVTPRINNVEFERSFNNYSNEGRNYATSSTPIQKNIPTFSVNFLPNILDQYDVVTYHWKFFMVTPEASSSGDIFNTSNQIIIAESAVTDFTIDNVIIESQASPSADGGTGLSTNIRFEILEPSSAVLLDKIYLQSLALGIGNWSVVPYYMQLQFKGRSPETSAAEDGSSGELSSLKWIWSIKLTDIKANVTSVGTKYEVTAIINNDLALSNAYASLPNTTVLRDLTNFEDAMKKLQDALNGDQIYRLIGTASIPDVYKIVVDPALGIYNITPSTHNTDSVRNDSTVKVDGKKNGTFPREIGIDKIIDSLLSQSEDAQKLARNASTPGGDGKSMNAEINQMKKFWRIITETRLLKYDPYQNDFAREFTYFVIQYDIGILDINTSQDSAGSSTRNAERKRLNTYIEKNILKKKYNYIFTGLNDQVINFDIKINSAMASSVGRMGGVYDNAAEIDKGMVNQIKSDNEAQLAERLRSTIAFLNTATKGEIEGDEGITVGSLRTDITTSELSPDVKERYIKILENAKPENRLNFVTERQALGQDTDGRLSAATTRARILAIPTVDKISNQQFNFLSDINTSRQNVLIEEAKTYSEIKGKLRPMARRDNMQSRQTGNGIESSSNSGIQKMSNAFSQALHSSLDVSFAHIILDIKGDPFWLFPQPVAEGDKKLYLTLEKDKVKAINFIKNAHIATRNAVNLRGTDNFLMLRFRTPRVFDIDNSPGDDTSAFQEVEMLSGIFKVNNIKSKFEMGKFHQEISCQMDYNINISQFISELEPAAGLPDVPTNPKELIDKSRLSDISTGQRILGKVDIPGVESQFSTSRITNLLNDIGTNIGSNIPSKIRNPLSGLPPTFG
jgi:hypothetical protein